MNCMLSFALLVAVVAMVSGQAAIAGLDKTQIPTMLKNKHLVEAHANCAIASEAEKNVKCDKMGLALRGALYKAIETGTCGCTKEEESTFAYTSLYVDKHYPDVSKKIHEGLKITPEQRKKYDDYIAKVPLPEGWIL